MQNRAYSVCLNMEVLQSFSLPTTKLESVCVLACHGIAVLLTLLKIDGKHQRFYQWLKVEYPLWRFLPASTWRRVTCPNLLCFIFHKHLKIDCLNTCCCIYKLTNIYSFWLHNPWNSALVWVRLWVTFPCLHKRGFMALSSFKNTSHITSIHSVVSNQWHRFCAISSNTTFYYLFQRYMFPSKTIINRRFL
jgi:hypothetical protein